MRKLIIGLMAIALLTAGCSHKVLMDDGTVQNVGSRESMEMYYQAKTQSEVKVAKFNAIAAATTERQGMLLAFEMGKGDGIQFQLRKTLDERALPWAQMLLGNWGSFIDMGNQKTGSINVEMGDGGTLNGFNMFDNGRDVVFDPDTSRSSSQTSTKNTSVATDIDKTYTFGE